MQPVCQIFSGGRLPAARSRQKAARQARDVHDEPFARFTCRSFGSTVRARLTGAILARLVKKSCALYPGAPRSLTDIYSWIRAKLPAPSAFVQATAAL